VIEEETEAEESSAWKETGGWKAKESLGPSQDNVQDFLTSLSATANWDDLLGKKTLSKDEVTLLPSATKNFKDEVPLLPLARQPTWPVDEPAAEPPA
ncbi:unnamed protein product, partial [Polarella glacialis]